jgi:small subunit ribosomal protein S20
MPNTKGARKAMRQSIKRRASNVITKDAIRESVKQVRRFVKQAKKSEAVTALAAAMSALDKAAKKGVIHKNTASRRKSRLAKSIAK